MKQIKIDHLIVVPSKRFSWKNGCGVAEVSDISDIAMDIFRLCRQVWDDACDVGFVIESELTGKQLLFILQGSDKDKEGSVEGWRFVSAEVKLGVLVNEFKLLIIND